jgi:hypothetical protein
MVVQQPTLLNGSIVGLLQGTASYALTSSYSQYNIGEQQPLLFYARIPPLATGINVYLNSSSAATLPFDDNTFYNMNFQTIGIIQGLRFIYNDYALEYYYMSSSKADYSDLRNLYLNDTNISSQLNSGSVSMTLNGSKDAYNKLKFTVAVNQIQAQTDLYIVLTPYIKYNVSNFPSTI